MPDRVRAGRKSREERIAAVRKIRKSPRDSSVVFCRFVTSDDALFEDRPSVRLILTMDSSISIRNHKSTFLY